MPNSKKIWQTSSEENTDSDEQQKELEITTSSHYVSNHPLLNQPPFQPHSSKPYEQQKEPPQIPQADVNHMPHFVPLSMPMGFYPAPPFRSISLPHIMPSYHLVPQYFVSPTSQSYSQDMDLNQSTSNYNDQLQRHPEAVTSVFKKTCYKCGNLGHYADACVFDERLCFNCKRPGHETSDCPYPRSSDLKQCYICREIGHLQSSCPYNNSAPLASPTHLQQSPFQYYPPGVPIIANENRTLFPGMSLNSAPASPYLGSRVHYFSNAEVSQRQQPGHYTNFINQRTLYLESANQAIYHRQGRAGSVPHIRTNY